MQQVLGEENGKIINNFFTTVGFAKLLKNKF